MYSDKYVSDGTALLEFKKHLNKKGFDYSHSEFNNIDMKVGIHKRLFVKNVCAIGLAAGFIEPLESNGLLSVHEFLLNLVNVLERGNISQWNRDNFNYSCKFFFDDFVEFVALHYALSNRTDTPYWKEINDKSFYENRLLETHLVSDIDCYMDQRIYFRSDGGIHFIGAGMNYIVIRIGHKKIPDNIKKMLQEREKELKNYNNICKNKSSLLEFLKNNIHKE